MNTNVRVTTWGAGEDCTQALPGEAEENSPVSELSEVQKVALSTVQVSCVKNGPPGGSSGKASSLEKK